MVHKLSYCVLFALCASFAATAQQPDSTQRDSLKVYRSLEEFAKKKKFTYRLYRAVFRPIVTEEVRPKEHPEKQKATVVKSVNYDGKIIRNIIIETTDPLGYSLRDTSKRPHSIIQKAGNSLHIKTKSIAIRNIILLRRNQPFDAYKAKESERLIRETGYIKEARLEVKPALPAEALAKADRKEIPYDSVDIYIRALDLWSITGGVRYSNTTKGFRIRDRNFLGLGNDVNSTLTFYEHNRAFESNYTIPTISNTHIITTFRLRADAASNLVQSVNIYRPFYSPLTRWAGGIFIGKHRSDDLLYMKEGIQVANMISSQGVDTWVARSWPLQSGQGELNGDLLHPHVPKTSTISPLKERKNFIAGFRYGNIDYTAGLYDTLSEIYSDKQFYLLSAGIVTRNYDIDNYLFKWGETEDVPTGSVIAVTVGKEFRNQHQRLYTGLKLGRSYYLNGAGYLNFSTNMGTLIHHDVFENTTLIARFTHFTRLYESGKWKFRNFAQTNFTAGFNRSLNEALRIYNDTLGIKGYQDADAYGTARLMATTQFQAYAPYSILGFRFAPLVFASGGFLSSDLQTLFRGRFYSALGLGFLIRNELLVISNLEVSFAFFPFIPGVGNDIWKYRPFRASGFLIEDFRIERPEMVPYR